MPRRFKAVVFDLDGTLVDEPSSWLTVHQKFQTSERAKGNLNTYEQGKITYAEFMARDIKLWLSSGKVHVDQIRDILAPHHLNADAIMLERALRGEGYKMFVISAGIDILAEMVHEKLRFDALLANGLEVDEEGFLTGRGIERVPLLQKQDAFRLMVQQHDLTTKDCIAVGDSRFDKPLLESAGLGVAFGPSGDILAGAQIHIERLGDLLEHLPM